MTKHKQTFFGQDLYTLKYLSDVSNTPQKQLRDWFEAGDLKAFMTIYESPTGRRWYRWGAPLYWEKPLRGHIYDLQSVVDPQDHHEDDAPEEVTA